MHHQANVAVAFGRCGNEFRQRADELAATGSRFTLQAYRDIWVGEAFWRPALNTILITLGVTAGVEVP